MISTSALIAGTSSDATACWIVLAVGAVGGVLVAIAKEAEKRKAREAYQSRLAHLRREPTDASLREDTLRLGRVYSDLTRNRKGVTVFDEVAIMNDINAVCAGATRLEHVSTKPSKPATTDSIESRLARLDALRQQNRITREEHHDRRQRLLDEI